LRTYPERDLCEISNKSQQGALEQARLIRRFLEDKTTLLL